MNLNFAPDSRVRDLSMPCLPSQASLSEADRTKLNAIQSVLLAPARWNDQTFGFLSLGPKHVGSFDAEDIEFLSVLMNHIGACVAQREIEKERRDLDQALEIQQALLPREIPVVVGYEISGEWLPARTVSGDYYDVFKLGERKVAICIGDVAGKRTPAALLMANVQAAVRSIASEDVSPSALCMRINAVLSGNVAPCRFITFFYAVIDSVANRMIYTCAGHNHPILVRRNRTQSRLDAGGTVLGLFAGSTYDEGSIQLEPDDRILLFTDGAPDAVNPAGEEFSEERLINI